MEFIYATQNQAKTKAMEKILKENNTNIKLHTLKEINFDEEIVENGQTFEENSEIKVRSVEKYCRQKGIQNKIIIADDAGLCIDKLNGEPGIYTARYAGEHPTQIENISKVLENMKQYDKMKDRTCCFVCVLTAIILQTGEKIVARGESKGYIAKEHGRLGGLTYGPIFIPEGFDIPMSEMREETYEKMHNHRDLAMKILLEEFKKRKIL